MQRLIVVAIAIQPDKSFFSCPIFIDDAFVDKNKPYFQHFVDQRAKIFKPCLTLDFADFHSAITVKQLNNESHALCQIHIFVVFVIRIKQDVGFTLHLKTGRHSCLIHLADTAQIVFGKPIP